MDRIILHSDINSCYASIEHAMHPELKNVPLAVGGSAEKRHGIILAKDEAAKKCGVKTAMNIWQAKQLCPELVVLPPRMKLYLEYSKAVRNIYSEYTNFQEPFGIDECWLDLTGCIGAGDGTAAAKEINRRIKQELNITVSIGVSWNKVFAKLGSDYRKPDAVTFVSKADFKNMIWPLPAEQLLYVGRATRTKLQRIGVSTIGDIARSDPEILHNLLGKMGYVLWAFANGEDHSPVRREDLGAPIKSVGNSTTTPRDLTNDEDVRISLMALAESVGMRLRDTGLKGKCISVSVRKNDLSWNSHQKNLDSYTNVTREIFLISMELFSQMHRWPTPIRSIGICVSELISADAAEQPDFFGEYEWRSKQARIDKSMDKLRQKYGFSCIKRGILDCDTALGSLNAKDGHEVHPIGFFGGH